MLGCWDADAVAQIIHEPNELNKSGPALEWQSASRVPQPAAKWPNTYFSGPSQSGVVTTTEFSGHIFYIFLLLVVCGL